MHVGQDAKTVFSGEFSISRFEKASPISRSIPGYQKILNSLERTWRAHIQPSTQNKNGCLRMYVRSEMCVFFHLFALHLSMLQ